MAKALDWKKAEEEKRKRKQRRDRAGARLTSLKLSTVADESGTCRICKRQYDEGERVASLIVEGQTHVCHRDCVYGKARELCLGSDGGKQCAVKTAPNASYCDRHLTERYQQMEERRVRNGLEAPERPQEPVRVIPREEAPKPLQRQPKRTPRQCVVMNNGEQCPKNEFANFMFCGGHMPLRRQILDAKGRR